jgi:hypothetical protein
VIPPCRRDRYDRTLASLHAHLPDIAFEGAWQTGQAMTLQEALDYALSTPSPEIGHLASHDAETIDHSSQS